MPRRGRAGVDPGTVRTPQEWLQAHASEKYPDADELQGLVNAIAVQLDSGTIVRMFARDMQADGFDLSMPEATR